MGENRTLSKVKHPLGNLHSWGGSSRKFSEEYNPFVQKNKWKKKPSLRKVSNCCVIFCQLVWLWNTTPPSFSNACLATNKLAHQIVCHQHHRLPLQSRSQRMTHYPKINNWLYNILPTWLVCNPLFHTHTHLISHEDRILCFHTLSCATSVSQWPFMAYHKPCSFKLGKKAAWKFILGQE